MKHWHLLLERRTKIRLEPDKTRRKLHRIAGSASREPFANFGFKGRVKKLAEPKQVFLKDDEKEWQYHALIRIEKVGAVKDDTETNWSLVRAALTKMAEAEDWTVKTEVEATINVDGGETDIPEVTLEDVVRPPKPDFVVPPLTDEVLATHFRGVYEREQHLRLIHDAVSNYAMTKAAWQKDPTVEIARSHIILKGKPAGAKTMVLERLKMWLDSDGHERVTFVDMHAATKAGLENWLLEKAEFGDLADIVVLEEIEKAQPLDALLPLVSIMGSGYLAKMNARIGFNKQLTNILVLATCNNPELIENWRAGVLWSRFATSSTVSGPAGNSCVASCSTRSRRWAATRSGWTPR
jgi:hypothetical protein